MIINFVVLANTAAQKTTLLVSLVYCLPFLADRAQLWCCLSQVFSAGLLGSGTSAKDYD